MNSSVNYLAKLLELDYHLKIYTDPSDNKVKIIKTKYGKYYSDVLDEDTLFNALVHMRACMLNKESNRER
jgi:hypothetical protein